MKIKIPSRIISERANVRAYVITKGPRAVAQIHILFPKDGAGLLRLECWHASPTEDGKRPRFQGATASGSGYDKATSAMSGIVVDGHRLADHCGETINGLYSREEKAPRGWYFCNFQAAKDGKPAGYGSLHKRAGVRYLEEKGYTVTQVF